jgi:hypothetical protein
MKVFKAEGRKKFRELPSYILWPASGEKGPEEF